VRTRRRPSRVRYCATRRLVLFNTQIAAIESRGYAFPNDAKRHTIHIKWRKANQKKLEAAAKYKEQAPQRKGEEMVGKRVKYLYEKMKVLEEKFDVRKHPGLRTPALFDAMDVGERVWRERIEVEGLGEEVGRIQDGVVWQYVPE
jgi:hypothetical protein